MENRYFIAIYTNEVKDYCDERFFERIKLIAKDNPVHIVDNTVSNNYFKRLKRITKESGFNLYKIMVPEHPKRTQFLRNVAESVNHLRDLFLDSDCQYFLIIESDVLPPEDLLDRLDKTIVDVLDNLKTPYTIITEDKRTQISNWGILGCHYYRGFHNFDMKYLYDTTHALSGCTVYKKELIEKYPFRWSADNLDAFPDAWISYDSGSEYSIWNDGSIECEHLNAENGTRQSKQL